MSDHAKNQAKNGGPLVRSRKPTIVPLIDKEAATLTIEVRHPFALDAQRVTLPFGYLHVLDAQVRLIEAGILMPVTADTPD